MQKAQRGAGLQDLTDALASEISSNCHSCAFTPFAGCCCRNLGPITLIPAQFDRYYRDVVNWVKYQLNNGGQPTYNWCVMD